MASTAAVPVAPPATPPNIAANATVTLTRPRTVMSPQARQPRGTGRCKATPRANRAAPAIRARNAANHSRGASRSPHSIATKHAPQAAVIHSIRNGLGLTGSATAPVMLTGTSTPTPLVSGCRTAPERWAPAPGPGLAARPGPAARAA